MKQLANRWICLVFLSLILISGCISTLQDRNITETSKDSQQLSLSTGSKINLITTDISSTGGIISINKPNEPLNGFTIEIPKGAYNNTTSFEISYKKIKNSTFSTIVNPISPLISIDNGGNYSDVPMIVTIPVNIPDGQFAMVFSYDSKEGITDALPLVKSNSTTITIITRHFSSFFVSSIDRNLLWSLSPDTGFRPGIDTWQIMNYGTVLSPGGACSGISITELWYYLVKKIKENKPPLYGLYDSTNGHVGTPNRWQDDVAAIVLTSQVQYDYEQDSFDISKQQFLSDSDLYLEFVNALQVIHNPQLLSMWSAQKGHLVIVYRAENNKLFIADPNFPNDTQRSIDLQNGEFSQYGEFTNYSFFSLKALESSFVLSERWKCFERNGASKCFWDPYPSFIVELQEYYPWNQCQGVLSSDPFVFRTKSLELDTSVDTIRKVAFCPHILNEEYVIYKNDQKVASTDIPLDYGENVIGIYRIIPPDDKGNYIWGGFVYVTVVRSDARKENNPSCFQTLDYESNFGNIPDLCVGAISKGYSNQGYSN